jgi:hypothetical protein
MFLARSTIRSKTPETFTEDLLKLRQLRSALLVDVSVRNKISWQTGNPYNKRWQYKIKNAYYGYPKEAEHTRVQKPEDSKAGTFLFHAWVQDWLFRIIPGFRMAWDRRSRLFDAFNVYLIPGSSLFFYQFWDLAFGFKVLTILPWALFYTRARDKTLDPDLKETYLRDMIYKNPEIAALFNEETIHVLDYDLEYDKGLPDAQKFPEYNNKTWRFFNTDTSMCTGFFRFGDLESGAVMNLKIKTMPVPGKFRYQVGEPFFFYDLRAEITHKGTFKEVVLVDEKETLTKMRPFLFLI